MRFVAKIGLCQNKVTKKTLMKNVRGKNACNFALLKEKERKLAIIRDLESERVEHELKINNIDDMVANLKLDIKDINKQMHEKGFDLKTYKNKKDLDNCIQKTIDYYNDHYTCRDGQQILPWTRP